MRVSSERLAAEAQHRLGRLVDSIPASLATRVAGGPRVIDGERLDPHLGVILAVEERLRGSDDDLTLEQRRRTLRTASRAAAGPPVPVGDVRDLEVDGGAGPLLARLYTPPGPSLAPSARPRPLVVFFHGGGWVVGDLDTHDQPCRLLCRHADVHVLSVDYRLAPEHVYPAAVEDAVAAFAWAREHAAGLGADPDRVAVAGDSAGGTLSAVVAQVARDEGTPGPVAQLLVYPGADASVDRPSKQLFSGLYLTRERMDWYWDTYSAGGSRTDPRLSPLCAERLDGLPPAVVATAALDPLRDEGEAYAEALEAAGVPVVRRRGRGLVHGYLSMTGINRASLEESIAVIGAFGALLDTVG